MGRVIVGFFMLMMFFAVRVDASDGKPPVSALEVMRHVSDFAADYCDVVDEYTSNVYIKGKLEVRKKNFLFRYIPSLFKLEKGVKRYMSESYNELHYTAPNIYDQKVVSEYGTIPNGKFQAEILEYFQLNVYAGSMVGERLMSPLSEYARKYYTYTMDSVFYRNDLLSYKIRFIPKSKSDRLIGGYMIVTDGVWTVREIRFSGHAELLLFENLIRMGEVGASDELLPRVFECRVDFKFLGNEMFGDYLTVYDYKNIVLRDSTQQVGKVKTYDLSNSFTLKCDTNAWKKGRSYIDSIRPVPLDRDEWRVYYLWEDRRAKDTVDVTKERSSRFLKTTQNVFFSDLSFDLPKLGKLKSSPIINPFLLSYSKSKGFSWRQDLGLSKNLPRGRSLSVGCRLGYNFTFKEFYWNLSTDWNYCPEKLGKVYVGIGNGQRIYSSEMLDGIRALPDSLVNFNQINLGYFKNLRLETYHSREIVNGLKLQVGVILNRRKALDLPKYAQEGVDLQVPSKYRKLFQSVYGSFAPRVKLEWTPGQYYYMNGNRKIPLYSRFPTFVLDYERGLGGILKNSCKYERLEFDMHQQITLKELERISYRVGIGGFTNRQNLYFVDFIYFRRNNLPVGWNDEIGGMFHLLNGGWYNSSRMYLRGHITYDAPFIFFKHLMKYTRYIQKEKIYGGILVMPHLIPYMELGYGIGTHIFDFGLFVGTEQFRDVKFGCKFTFELFN